MKKLAIILLVFTSCRCPQVIQSGTVSTHDSTTTITRDTVFSHKTDTVASAPIVIHDTVNFSEICDSISKGLAVHSLKKVKGGTVAVITDSLGKGVIICQTDSLQKIIDSLSVTVTNNITTNVKDSTIQTIAIFRESGKQKFYRIWTWCTWGAVVLIGIGIYLGKR